MRKSKDPCYLLLQISRCFGSEGEKHQEVEVGSSVARFRAIMRSQYDLSCDEVLLVSVLFREFMKGEKEINPLRFLNKVYPDPYQIIEKLDRIIKLIESGVLVFTKGNPIDELARYHRRSSAAIDRMDLVESDLIFSPAFIRAIMCNDLIAASTPHPPYENNQQFLKDCFSHMEHIQAARMRRVANFMPGDFAENEPLLAQRKYILQRLENSQVIIPFGKLVRKYDLSNEEQILIMYLLHANISNEVAYKKSAINLLSYDLQEMNRIKKILSSDSKLLIEGIIIPLESDQSGASQNSIQLSPDIISLLLGDDEVSDANKLHEIIADNDLFALVRPENDFRSLVLEDGIIDILKDGILQFNRDCSKTLSCWGFGIYAAEEVSFNKLVHREYEPSVRVLLYGPPGTGKTFTSYAIAKELGKEVLVTDMSRILSKWVGESERNTMLIFKTFARIHNSTDNPPALLLNEADQFLTGRSAADGPVNRMYNQMQNIFLEQFERFKGVLIATTNLLENIDPAFSRRFDLKIKLDMPPRQLREKLWKKLMPSRTPLASDIDVPYLASEYRLSGGQIATVIRNAAIAASAREGESKRIFQEDLLKYAKIEGQNSFGGYKKAIGFDW